MYLLQERYSLVVSISLFLLLGALCHQSHYRLSEQNRLQISQEERRPTGQSQCPPPPPNRLSCTGDVHGAQNSRTDGGTKSRRYQGCSFSIKAHIHCFAILLQLPIPSGRASDTRCFSKPWPHVAYIGKFAAARPIIKQRVRSCLTALS